VEFHEVGEGVRDVVQHLRPLLVSGLLDPLPRITRRPPVLQGGELSFNLLDLFGVSDAGKGGQAL
jgi:hypothetical protein